MVKSVSKINQQLSYELKLPAAQCFGGLTMGGSVFTN